MPITHSALLAASSLKVPWGQTPMYNTIMSVAAGAALLLVVALGYFLYQRKPILAEGWAAAFVALGAILTITGAHMTLTWPLSNIAPFDNVIFGEPSLAFGIILLIIAAVLWTKKAVLASPRDDGIGSLTYLRRLAGPVSVFAAAIGMGLLGIAAAGWNYTLFAAPPQEPISGILSGHPLIEATFISGLYLLTGLGLILFPVALKWLNRRIATAVGLLWAIPGIAFVAFGALNYFTHIGLIIHTS